MGIISTLLLILLPFVLSPQVSTSAIVDPMLQGSSLSVEEPKDVMVSPNGMFSAGFYVVGENAYSFAIWFSEPPFDQPQNPIVVWMANPDHPVNGQGSKLSLLHNGNLVLNDADESNVWSTNTVSLSSVHQLLYDMFCVKQNVMVSSCGRALIFLQIPFFLNKCSPN
ncbi:Bulb-type lectin domain [Sesbania bispinosa]|nr:Bulb-type lectin domain [Sesbania bispinosa]